MSGADTGHGRERAWNLDNGVGFAKVEPDNGAGLLQWNPVMVFDCGSGTR